MRVLLVVASDRRHYLGEARPLCLKLTRQRLKAGCALIASRVVRPRAFEIYADCIKRGIVGVGGVSALFGGGASSGIIYAGV
jgi:hypothetical protein